MWQINFFFWWISAFSTESAGPKVVTLVLQGLRYLWNRFLELLWHWNKNFTWTLLNWILWPKINIQLTDLGKMGLLIQTEFPPILALVCSFQLQKSESESWQCQAGSEFVLAETIAWWHCQLRAGHYTLKGKENICYTSIVLKSSLILHTAQPEAQIWKQFLKA